MIICPDCGKKVPEAKFCKNCGAYILNVKEVELVNDTIENDEILLESGDLTDAEPVDVVLADKEISIEDNEVEEITPVPVHIHEDKKVRFCFNCGYELNGDIKFCPNCGQDLTSKTVESSEKSVTAKGQKSVLLAVILSVFLPGLGQIYLGLDHKGAMFLIAYVISAILILLLIGFLLCGVIWIWALVDTIISANALNRGEEVNDKLL